MLDSYNREIKCLRISVTDRCNLRCTYCMPPRGVKLKNRNEILSFEQITRVVRAAAKLGISKIRLTGGEPLCRKNITSLIRSLTTIEGIDEVTMTTNGVLLAQMASALKRSGLCRLNVSLDTLDPQKYTNITRGGDIRKVLEGIDSALEAGFVKTKVNMVIIPGLNDEDVDSMKIFCSKKGIKMQRINHYGLSERQSINSAYEAERPLCCHLCNRIRLMADGKLKPCLFSDLEIPVDFQDIKASIKQAVFLKPEKGKGCTTRGNWQIGG